MTNILSSTQNYSNQPLHGLFLIIEGKKFEWPKQFITGEQVRVLANLPNDGELFLEVRNPWRDEKINDDEKINLARPGIEQFFLKKDLKYSINGQSFQSSRQYIKGQRIREEGNIPFEHEIYLSMEKPWQDELIKDGEWVNLARPGVEHFVSRKKETKIIVNGSLKEWHTDTISFKEVIELAYGTYSDKPTMVYTVAFEDGPKSNPEGSMLKGTIVDVKNKMIFHATATDKS